jgi:hypothetical protein
MNDAEFRTPLFIIHYPLSIILINWASIMHIDGQQVAAFAIVAVAALSVGRRMAGQFAAFRASNKSSGCGGCDGCGSTKVTKSEAPLVQIQTRPPVRLKRHQGT